MSVKADARLTRDDVRQQNPTRLMMIRVSFILDRYLMLLRASSEWRRYGMRWWQQLQAGDRTNMIGSKLSERWGKVTDDIDRYLKPSGWFQTGETQECSLSHSCGLRFPSDRSLNNPRLLHGQMARLFQVNSYLDLSQSLTTFQICSLLRKNGWPGSMV